MKRFARRPPFESYSPGRKDSRIGEARAMLGAAAHLRNVTPHSLGCLFNLKDETAAALIAEEQGRRGT